MGGEQNRSIDEVEITIDKMLKRRGHEPESDHWNMAAQGGYQGKPQALRVALKLRDGSLTLMWHLVSERAAAWSLLLRTRELGRKDNGRKESIKEKGQDPSLPCLPTETTVSAPGS